MAGIIMNKKEAPLVSCIMPTYNRRKFVPYAIDYFLRQQYSNKELIIVDDGDDIIEDIIPQNPLIRYYCLNKKITLGAKLNLACSYAQGEIIANWDDDDWYAKTRLQYQVNALENTKAEVCGINNLLYYHIKNRTGYRYIYPLDQRPWLLGSSLCYTKKLWCNNQFADIDIGMDGLFVWRTPVKAVKVLPDSTMSVHMIHENNISPKKTNGKWWQSYPVEDIQKLMNDDWDLYKNDSAPSAKKIIIKPAIAGNLLLDKPEPLKNIYACLVHENIECIIDLVRNLYYNDPSSVILLYNGGKDEKLLNIDFTFEHFNAVIHPKPCLVKHGYLHQFALDCMEFSLENFVFDVITMVDSDQLALQPGYSSYLKKSLVFSPGVGMLSNKPKRLTSDDNSDNEVWPAMQAFKEFDLWKPLLEKFTDGESKFVHWTFWPSCVFSFNAASDLVKLFKENKLLKKIMDQTKLWATEEVVLPTLVALLGYNIAHNPCNYEFVKYQKTFTLNDVDRALNKTDAFWMHPIKREYHDALRNKVRERCNYYVHPKEIIAINEAEEILMALPLLDTIKKIEGWLSDKEADLLIAITIKALMHLPAPHTIVEVGCYHGKSTIIFGSVLQKLFRYGKVYSIDPHDGKLGDAYNVLHTCPPSFNIFKKNIEEAGLNKFVEAIKDYSCNVKWDQPISILFIDGLHDYLNVSKDFRHFSKWICKEGYVAFHDYADYFPGVQVLVNEVLATGEYCKILLAGSLIVLKKL